MKYALNITTNLAAIEFH